MTRGNGDDDDEGEVFGLLRAACSNNRGVQLLETGKVPEAILEFQSAFSAVKACADAMAPAPPMWTQAFVKQDSFNGLLQEEPRHVHLSGLKNEACYLYDRPILLRTNFSFSLHRGTSAIVLILGAIVTFNLALAYHHAGKISGISKALYKAVELYGFTLVIISRSESGGDDRLHAILRSLVMNNLAEYYYDQCEYVASESCLVCLYDLAVTLDCLNDSHLDSSETKEILLNLMHMRAPSVAKVA